MLEIPIPECIPDRMKELDELCERYPETIPTPEAAKFLRMHTENLKACIEAGRCPFAFCWQRSIKGNRAFKIPTLTFYIWITHGMTLVK